MTGQPFAAVRVLDFTRFLAGSFGSYQLALLGADVIKIEPREGEEMRQTQAGALWAERKRSPSWLSVNGNKRSLTLDLRKPEATAIVKRLAAGVDVVWENFRPGVMDRLGIGTLKRFVNGMVLPVGPVEHRVATTAALARVRTSDDLREGLAVYKEKRKPQFTGR